MGIEPTYSAWKAAALPLSYTRAGGLLQPRYPVFKSQSFRRQILQCSFLSSEPDEFRVHRARAVKTILQGKYVGLRQEETAFIHKVGVEHEPSCSSIQPGQQRTIALAPGIQDSGIQLLPVQLCCTVRRCLLTCSAAHLWKT